MPALIPGERATIAGAASTTWSTVSGAPCWRPAGAARPGLAGGARSGAYPGTAGWPGAGKSHHHYHR
jgi:hypothetical protein